MTLDLLGRGTDETGTPDLEVITLLDAILEELRKINLHLALMNDVIVDSTEVET